MRRKLPVDDGFRHPGDFGQGPRFPWGFAESRVPMADASYQGYGAYASLDGGRIDHSEYAELDYAGMELESPEGGEGEDEPGREPVPLDHTGRGPRGYRRSDVSIRDDLHVVLTAHGEIDAADVELLVAGGEVLLRGDVPDRATKRLIEDIVYQIAGVRDVTNRLRIGARAPDPDAPQRLRDEPVESRPRSTTADDHPSRRDAWMAGELGDRGSADDQALRRVERSDLRSHDYTGPRDTSADERLGPPDLPLSRLTPSGAAPPPGEEVEVEVEGPEEEELGS